MSRRVHRRRAFRRPPTMSFRARLFAFLALTGVLPVALLGWLSFSLHRAEVERTVSRAQVAVAAEAARNVERTVASAVDGLRLSVGALPLAQLSDAELASVLRIPYRQLPAVGAVALLGNDGKLLAPAVYEPDAQKPDAFSDADLQARLVRRADQSEWLAAAAPVGGMGWAVGVAQPASAAFSGAVRVRDYTIFWAAVALLLTALLGALLARGLSQPVRELSQGVSALAEGRYDQTVQGDTRDELGQLAEGFNQMAREIRRRDEEIRAWNIELQQRVEHRTAELKMAQDQILRTRRLAAIGSLGAGIAHELNNPLTAVAGLISLARKQLGESSPHSDTLKQALEQARRVSKIVGDLRQFAEQERTHGGRRFPLSQPVQSALDLYAEELREKGIDVRQEVKAGLREAQGDPLQIQQVIAHLLQNAIAAMPEGGELRIGLTDVAGDALKLTVSDSGKGIPTEMRERIFDPFFSTKDAAAGVGLGLSISHSIVEAHHGKLLVDSAPGRGATFTVLLPAAAPAAHLV